MPGLNAGTLTLADLEKLTAIVRKYDIPMIKVTGAQRFFFHGLAPEKMQALKQELGIPPTPPHKNKKLHYVQACPGKQWCQYGHQETLEMAKKLSAMVLDEPLPHKVKVAISGCRFCCCESLMRDVGLTGESKGWRFTFGGNAAGRPRIGDEVARHLSDDEALELIRRVLHFYATTSRFKSRSARFMERIGIEELKKHIL